MFIAHTGYLELFDLVVKHILPGMGLFFYFVLHFNCKFAPQNQKILSTNHHYGNPSTRFSVEPVLLESTNSNNTPAFIHYRITNTEIGEYLAM